MIEDVLKVVVKLNIINMNLEKHVMKNALLINLLLQMKQIIISVK